MLILLIFVNANKYQQYLFNFSSLVFNNSPKSTLESFSCGTQLFLGNQVLFLSQVRLSIFSDCLFATLTWSIAYFPCLIELFYHLANVSRRICSFSRWRNYCGPSCGELQSHFYLSSFSELNS